MDICLKELAWISIRKNALYFMRMIELLKSRIKRMQSAEQNMKKSIHHQEKRCGDEFMDVIYHTGKMEIEELLCTCDLCISDYSSLIFEYSLFERPLVFFAYDLEEYGDWRGFYYDYEELTPGPVLRTTVEVIQYIRETEKEFDPERIRAFRNKFMSACDGHATDRLIELVTERRH